ncbi:DUF11 domain-containing protein [Nocardioides deserti]|uniref:DUF11 domain-containing protein n=1 Tax=Nocardioides deserti TaxID=1588644 RepID=A0ABR6UCZ1_9ACTN|nr:DUF11 domain-containing protein [Nocardioides deserti]MBC2962326.1 DUF11 domain-containing protein [Nocardioides deserti]GGO79195.1 hypothetical protein GCM10012276_38380 [Nocardioides deserti]
MGRGRRSSYAALAFALLGGSLAVVAGPVAPAYAAESLVVTKEADDAVLVGGGGTVTLRAENAGDQPEYNLSFRDRLPLGARYVAGSTRPAGGEPRVVTGQDGRQTLVWQNLSDLPVDAVQELTFEITTDPMVLPVGSRFDNVAQAYASAEPRDVPDFDADGVYVGDDASVQGESAAIATDVTAIEVEKHEPSPEHELRRGVHAHSTVYTLEVRNNSRFANNDVVLVDHLPAQLEFLGCGTVDNTADGAVEYDGAPRLDVSTPDVTAECPEPESVETVTDPGGLPAGVYTRVEWHLGTLAADTIVDVRYRAGIPQRANADEFPGVRPTAESLEQVANLDNNTGPSTRETLDEQALTNHALATADYTGPVAPGTSTRVSDTDELTVTAEDLAVQKSVSPGRFTHGDIATYTLQLQTGEYADATDVVLTDTIPNGLCPIGTPTTGAAADCAGSGGAEPSEAFRSVTANDDGSFTVVFEPLAIDASGEATVTYQARMLPTYRDGDTPPTVTGDSYTNTVALTGTTTTLADVEAPGGVAEQSVRDASEARIESDTVALDKRIQPNGSGAAPLTCSPTAGAYEDAADPTDPRFTFTEGSRVCFTIRVDFPDGNDTRNAVLTDFLPTGLAYDAGSLQPMADNDVPAVVDEAKLTFTLGTERDGARFVDRGSVFHYRLSATVTDPAAGTTPDVTGNLAKLRWVSTEGQVGFLRDREDFAIAPAAAVRVEKSARRVTATPPGAPTDLPDDSTAAEHRVRAGDVVEFSVTTTNAGTAAAGNARDVIGPDVWDRLPAGITCAQVTAITDGGECTDPADTEHPPFDGDDERSAIRWDLDDSVRIAAGDSRTVTYRVTYPARVSATNSYRNDVDIAQYASENNQGVLLDHRPQDNVDTTVPEDDQDVPRAHDDHTLRTPDVGVTKRNETVLDDASQGADPGGRNYAVIGEQVEYVIEATLPAETTIYDGVLRDIAPSGLRVDDVEYRYRTGPAATWGPLPVGAGTTTPPAAPRITLPPQLAVGPEDDGLRMVVTATVVSDAANTHGARRRNTARFTSVDENGDANANREATSDVYTVLPRPAPTKTADVTSPVAGQTVTYTVVARNVDPTAPGAIRPTLHDAALVDCVPAGLEVVGTPTVTGGGTVTVGGPGGAGCAGSTTPITWEVGDLPWRDTAAAGAAPWPVLTYQVRVDPDAAGGAAYTNTARLSGTSLDGTDPDEATYVGETDETVTVPGSTLTKTVTPSRAPIGATVDYEVTVELPAAVNFYDASVIDQLPAGIDPASVSTPTTTCTYAGGDPAETCTVGVAGGLGTDAALHGWHLGDVRSDDRPRLLTIGYSATLADVASSVAGTPLVNSAVLRWNQTDRFTTPAVDDDFDSASGSDDATVTVLEPDLRIEKTVSDETPLPGETFTYTVRITNADGPTTSTAHDVDVVDTLPAGVRVVAVVGGTQGTDADDNATITWNDLGPIEPGGSVERTYTARLASPAPAEPQTNTVGVTEHTSVDGGGRVYGGPEDTAVVTAGLPDLEVDKTVLDGPPAYVGEPTRWQVVVTNTGPATAHDVDLVDVLPEHWTYDEGTARVSVAGAAATAVEPTASGSPAQTLTWTDLGDLAEGRSLTVVLSATPGEAVVTADLVGSTVPHVNAATATARDLEGSDEVVSTDDDTAETRIDAADLRLEKEPVGTPVAGEPFSWTVEVVNDGPDQARGPFTVTDDLPAGATSASGSGTGWTCSVAGTALTCSTGSAATLAAGASLPDLTVTATVPADTAAGAELTNTASVTGRTLETDEDDNTDEATATVTTVADLGIDKQLGGDLVPGGTATYTLDVRNDGPSYAAGPVVVTDVLPDGVTYDSFTGAGWSLERDGQELTFTWTGATPVAVGAMPRISVTVDVASDLTDAVSNTATVAEPTDPTSGPESPDSDTVTSTPVPSADLAVAKASVGAFRAGTRGVYEMTVVNHGPSDSAGPVRVTDTLPDELTYVSVTSDDGWTCAAAGQDLTCTLLAGLPVGETSTFRVTVGIDEALTGDVENTATVVTTTPDPNPGNDTDTDDTGITVEADLALTKELTTDPVVAGSEATYVLQVRNEGPATSPGPIAVTDALPAGTTYVAASGTGWSCSAVGQLVTCERADGLAAATDAPPITLEVAVDSGVGTTTLTNRADVDGPATDPVPANDTDDEPTPVTEDTEISVAKTVAGADPVRAGENATFRVVVTNDGPSDARAVVVTDVLPAGMTLVSAAGDGWSCTAGVCTRDRVVAGASAPPLTVVARVASGTAAGTTLTNAVSVTTSTPGDTPAGNTDEASVGVVVAADLAVDKTHPTGGAVAGQPTTFAIAVRNNGPSDAAGPITVVDTLPTGVRYLSANAPWTCTAAAAGTARVTCTLPTGLVAGASAPVLSLQVQVLGSAETGTVVNTASVSSPTPDPVPGNDTDGAELAVDQLTDLSITKTHTGPVRVGRTLEFTLVVTNDGPSEARGVVVTDVLPSGLDLVSATGAGWTCAEVAGEVRCTLAGPLAPGTSAPPIAVVAGVTPQAYPGVRNVAQVGSSTPESDPTDNEATDEVAVPPLVDLVMDKARLGDLVVGQQATYRLLVTNRGPTPAPGPITVTDVLPAGLALVSAEGEGGGAWTCGSAGRTVTCVLDGTLGVGDSAAVQVIVDVLPAAWPKVANSASVTSPFEDVDGPGGGDGTDNGTGIDTGTVDAGVDLAVAKEAVRVGAGRVVYRIIVTNGGSGPTVRPVRVRDPLPAGLRLVSVTGDGWSCGSAAGRADCTYAAPVGPGESVSIRLVTRVTAAPGTELSNTAFVVGGGGGANAGDQDVAVVTVPAAGDPGTGTSPDGAGGQPDGGDGSGGLLPDTGGPRLLLLLLGFALCGLGAVVTVRHRRRW